MQLAAVIRLAQYLSSSSCSVARMLLSHLTMASSPSLLVRVSPFRFNCCLVIHKYLQTPSTRSGSTSSSRTSRLYDSSPPIPSLELSARLRFDSRDLRHSVLHRDTFPWSDLSGSDSRAAFRVVSSPIHAKMCLQSNHLLAKCVRVAVIYRQPDSCRCQPYIGRRGPGASEPCTPRSFS